MKKPDTEASNATWSVVSTTRRSLFWTRQWLRLRLVAHWLRRVYRIVRRRIPARLVRAILIPSALMVIGTIGYRLIEGPHWSWFDGFYMTGITLTTLGYSEVHPLSTAGRIFTLFLSYSGIFVLFYFGTELVRFVVTGDLQELIGKDRMEEELSSLKRHLIVCGLGRMGKIVCDELEHQGRQFVLIERDALRLEPWSYRHGYRLLGDATNDEILRKAGIERAEALITVVGSDSDNLYITLSARLLNPRLQIVARAEEEEAESKLHKVGANKVISPYLAGGLRAVYAALRPSTLHFMELTTRPEFLDLQIEEIKISAKSPLVGQTLRQSQLHEKYGALVVGIIQSSGDLKYNPTADTILEARSTLIVLGQRQQLQFVEKLADGN